MCTRVYIVYVYIYIYIHCICDICKAFTKVLSPAPAVVSGFAILILNLLPGVWGHKCLGNVRDSMEMLGWCGRTNLDTFAKIETD